LLPIWCFAAHLLVLAGYSQLARSNRRSFRGRSHQYSLYGFASRDQPVLFFFRSQQVIIEDNDNTIDLSFQDISDDDTIVTPLLEQTAGRINIIYTPQTYTFGESYFYSVGRITAERIRSTTTGGGANGGATTEVTLQPVRSPVGAQTGRYTPLFRPEIADTSEDTDNFVVVVDTNLTAYDLITANGGFNFAAVGYQLPTNANVTTGANEFRIEVSRTATFDRASTFVSPNLAPPPNIGPGGSAQFNLGGIRIPDLNGEPYRPGQTLFVRVLSRNTDDIVNQPRISPTVSFVEDSTTTLAASRFLATPGTKRGAGVGLGRIGGAARSAASGSYTAPRVLQPRR
jgi:hypothetical protein